MVYFCNMKGLVRLPALAFMIVSLMASGCGNTYQGEDNKKSSRTSLNSDAVPTQIGYSPVFFQNPPMLEAGGTEIPAQENSARLTWSTIPTPFELSAPASFTLLNGQTHWYQSVYLPQGGVNWVQAQELAQQNGGYLVSFHSQQENDFVFSLVEDEKFWRKFPRGEIDDGSPLYNLSGPYLGGYQVHGAREPDGGWAWVSGEPMSWTNWLQEGLDIGVHILPDNQPNNSARGAQNVMAFGEVDHVASYWCDVSHLMGTYGSGRLPSHGFIIEYNAEP